MDNVDEIDLKELFWVIWSKKGIIIFSILIGAILGFVYTKWFAVPKYSSSTTLILSKPVSVTAEYKSSDNSITQADISLNQKLISTYGEIIKSKKVVNQVIDNLNIDAKYDYNYLIKGISTTSVDDTDVVKVTVTTIDPELSANVANEIVAVFSEEVVKIYSIQNISVIDLAQANYEPINISYVKNIVVFAMIFGVIVLGIIFCVFYFDTTVNSNDEIESVFGIPVLGTIPKFDAEREVSPVLISKNNLLGTLRKVNTNEEESINEKN